MGSEHHRTREGEHLADLLARCAERDHRAFEALYDATRTRVYGLTLRVLHDPSHAEEIAQETYLHLWCSAGRYDADKGSPQSWILMIAHRKAVDRVRRTERAKQRDVVYSRREPGMTHDSTSETACAMVDAAPVRAAWSRLSPKRREALDLAYFGGRTHREVASALRIPVGTAKSRIRDGLVQLRHELGLPTFPVATGAP